MKKYLALFMTSIVLVGASLPLYASQLNDKKDELSELQQQIEQAEDTIGQKQEEKTQAEVEIAALDAEIIVAEEAVLDAKNNLLAKQEEVAITEVALEEAITKKDIQYEATKARMVQMYKNGKTGYMELVFSSNNLSELLNRSQYVKVISDYDNEVLDAYKVQEQIVYEKTLQLAEEEAALATLHAQQVAMTKGLETKKQQKDAYITSLTAEMNSLEALIASKEEESKKVQEEIKKLTQSSTLTYAGGAFAWPVPNYYRVSSDYYERINPVTGNWEFHNGIDIPAAYGSPVVAAADGKVIFAGPRGTFGNTVIIDHGSGLTTLYAHHSAVTVSTGMMVRKGDQIAKIGSTGRSTGNHTHFEVAINGDRVTPWNYIKK